MHVILISGQMGSGKDEIAKTLNAYFTLFRYSVNILHFADPIKQVARDYFGWDGEKDAKGRRLLQVLGTEAGREYDKDIWVKKTLHSIDTLNRQGDKVIVIIPDWRFPNECSYLEERRISVTTIRVESDHAFNREVTGTNHASEVSLPTGMDDKEWYDFIVKNDGSLEDLQQKVVLIAADIAEYELKH